MVMSISKTCLDQFFQLADWGGDEGAFADFLRQNEIYGVAGALFVREGGFAEGLGRMVGEDGKAEPLQQPHDPRGGPLVAKP